MSTLFLRLDASALRGLGHAFRCATIAEAWASSGADFRLCCNEVTDFVRARYAELGGAVFPAGAVDSAGAGDVVVFDGYDLGPAVEAAAAGRGAMVVAFDDLGARHDACALIIDPKPLPDLPPRGGALTTELLGCAYAPVAARFARARTRQRTKTGAALVVFGGTDPLKRSESAASALRAAGKRVRVVFTSAVAELHERRRALEAAGCEVVVDVDIAQVVQDVDVAVASASTVCLELLCAGVPVAATCLINNQRALHRGLVALEATVDLDACPDVVEATDRAIARGVGHRIDGFGPARIVDAIRARLAGRPVLRPAVARDADAVYALANEPDVRAASFSSDPIAYAQHIAWFTPRLVEEQPSLWLACEGSAVLGQGRLDSVQRDTCIVSVSVARDARGRGIARSVLEGLEREAARRAARRLQAEIKSDNVASLSLFASCGYRFDETFTRNGIEARRFIKEI